MGETDNDTCWPGIQLSLYINCTTPVPVVKRQFLGRDEGGKTEGTPRLALAGGGGVAALDMIIMGEHQAMLFDFFHRPRIL